MFVYYKTGDCSNIIVKDEGEGVEYDAYRGLSLHYYSNRSLKLAMWERWTQDEEAGFVGFGVHAAREFKFDSGRARYLWQDYDTHYDPNEPPGESGWPETWTAAGRVGRAGELGPRRAAASYASGSSAGTTFLPG